MSKNLKISIALVAVALIGVIAFAQLGKDDATPRATSGEVDRLVPPDSQFLSVVEDAKATFVEFLDFECESCRAAHPAIEELRKTYAGRVAFVVRNFPLHKNSEAAARAAAAAGAQNRFVDMYNKLFETQPTWGERSDSQEKVFFGFAEELGLDMTGFRAVYDDPATLERIRRDKADGIALGVSATPTFFLNGTKVEAASYDDLIAAIDAALAE